MQHEKVLIQYLTNESFQENIALKFPQLFQQINDLLQKIKLCETAQIASINFDILEEIHLMLTKLIYIRKIPLPNVLLKFFEDFENVYNLKGRNNLFNEIKYNNYHLNFEQFCLEEINGLFHKIKMCETASESKRYFEVLDEIFYMIAIKISEGKRELPETLWKFYKDFDHMDQLDYLFNKIKNESYSLE